MTAIEHIIWDWNGTLLDDAPLAWQVFNAMLLRRKLPGISFETYRSLYGHPVRGLYEQAGFDLSREMFEDLSDEWHEHYLRRLPETDLHHDTLATLQRIQSAARTQAVLSALPHDLLCESIAHHGIGIFFAEVLGLSDRLGRSKLDNARALLQKLGARADATVMIGDSAHDAEVAHALGVRCFLVRRGFESAERVNRHGLPVFDDFTQLLEHFAF